MLAGAGPRLQWRSAIRPGSVVELKDDLGTPNQPELVPGRPLDGSRIVLDSSYLGAKLPNLLGQAGHLIVGPDLFLA